MHEVIGNIKSGLDAAGGLTEVLLDAASVICIVYGVIKSIIVSLLNKTKVKERYTAHMFFRMKFAGWLVVALEFQLAADIVATIISPTNEHLIQLGAVAVIRTFLNYFLSRELKEEMEYSRT